MQMARRIEPSLPEPGIYELGKIHGEQAFGAWDTEGEFTIRTGPDAYGQLEDWLKQRGVKLPPGRPALFIVRLLPWFLFLNGIGGHLAYLPA